MAQCVGHVLAASLPFVGTVSLDAEESAKASLKFAKEEILR